MHRIDGPGHDSYMFTEGDPGTGTPATTVTADWLNDVQEELCDFIEREGITLAKGTTTQLSEAVDLALGRQAHGFRNWLINGAFRYWQRGSTFSFGASGSGYTADRFRCYNGASGVATQSQQSHTVGQSSVPGGGIRYFRWQQTTQATTTAPHIEQRLIELQSRYAIEVTFSFYAKVAAGSINVTPRVRQYFGTGGTPSSTVDTDGSPIAIGASWAKKSWTVTIPTISGKTMGTNGDHYLAFMLVLPTGQTFTLDLDTLQVAAGAYAGSFDVRPDDFELELCQQYYTKSYGPEISPGTTNAGGAIYTRQDGLDLRTLQRLLPVAMRSIPTITWYSVGTGTAQRVEYPDGTNRTVTGQNNTHRGSTGWPVQAYNAPAQTYARGHFTADAEL